MAQVFIPLGGKPGTTRTRKMMMLYSAALSMFGAKVQIALIEKGIDFQLVMVPYDRDRGYEPCSRKRAGRQG